jgi:tetratricopeptide (TPR) repeat protein
MIKEKPVQGFGYGGFKANYMNYQAQYFEEHPDSKQAVLADNVNRPFNEYLLLLTDYGLMGFILFLAFVWLLGKSYHRNRSKSILVRISGWCLLSIGVFSLFSYPLTYPFVWIMGITSILIIIRHIKWTLKIPSAVIPSLKLIMIPVVIISFQTIYQRMSVEKLWCQTANKSLLGKTEQMLPLYEQLHKYMADNELFLYNYAAELNVVKQYDKSLAIAHECGQLWADYDLQMLMADNYKELHQYEEAEFHYLKASNMCPVKFMPLYELYKLYEASGEKEKASEIAGKIIEKPIKVMSPTIQNIQREVKQKIKEL